MMSLFLFCLFAIDSLIHVGGVFKMMDGLMLMMTEAYLMIDG